MSNEYYLVKVDYLDYFNLGKGLWKLNFDITQANKPFIVPQTWAIPTILGERIENIIKDDCWKIDDPFVYSQGLANKIFEFAKYDRILLVYDTDVEWLDMTLKEYSSFLDVKDRKQPFDLWKMYIESGTRYE